MGDISPLLDQNRAWVKRRFEKCDDILNRQVFLEDGSYDLRDLVSEFGRKEEGSPC